MRARDARRACTKVQRGGDDCDGDQGEADGARDGGKIEETAAHQWNICAEPA